MRARNALVTSGPQLIVPCPRLPSWMPSSTCGSLHRQSKSVTSSSPLGKAGTSILCWTARMSSTVTLGERGRPAWTTKMEPSMLAASGMWLKRSWNNSNASESYLARTSSQKRRPAPPAAR